MELKFSDECINLLIMDVDGTLTDGKIYMSAEGEIFKSFSVKDGCGIHDILHPAGILPIIITGRKSLIVEKRCRELGITEIHQGIQDKASHLEKIISEFNRNRNYNIQLKNMAYIGDDINDLSCMHLVKSAGGVVGCPCDASIEVLKISNFVSSQRGGDGAVRDFIEWIVALNQGLNIKSK